jgi:hypothetical protein
MARFQKSANFMGPIGCRISRYRPFWERQRPFGNSSQTDQVKSVDRPFGKNDARALAAPAPAHRFFRDR